MYTTDNTSGSSTSTSAIPITTRRMYWRRASIQDGQAPGDATVLKRFSAMTSLFFVEVEKNSIFEISEFFYLCPYVNFQFPWWSRDHFSAPFRGLYRPISLTSTVSKVLRVFRGTVDPKSGRD